MASCTKFYSVCSIGILQGSIYKIFLEIFDESGLINQHPQLLKPNVELSELSWDSVMYSFL